MLRHDAPILPTGLRSRPRVDNALEETQGRGMTVAGT